MDPLFYARERINSGVQRVLVTRRKCLACGVSVEQTVQRTSGGKDVGSAHGCGPRFGARSAGFRGRLGAGRWRWMSGAEAAEGGFHRRGKRSMVVSGGVQDRCLQEVRGRSST